MARAGVERFVGWVTALLVGGTPVASRSASQAPTLDPADNDLQRAGLLHEEADELADDGRYVEAARRYGDALDLVSSPLTRGGIIYNRALAYHRAFAAVQHDGLPYLCRAWEDYVTLAEGGSAAGYHSEDVAAATKDLGRLEDSLGELLARVSATDEGVELTGDDALDRWQRLAELLSCDACCSDRAESTSRNASKVKAAMGQLEEQMGRQWGPPSRSSKLRYERLLQDASAIGYDSSHLQDMREAMVTRRDIPVVMPLALTGGTILTGGVVTTYAASRLQPRDRADFEGANLTPQRIDELLALQQRRATGLAVLGGALLTAGAGLVAASVVVAVQERRAHRRGRGRGQGR